MESFVFSFGQATRVGIRIYMRTNKNTSKIILAVIVAFLATMISYSAFSNMQRQMHEQRKLIDLMQKTPPKNQNIGNFAYAVATVNLKAGEIVSDSDVDFQSFDVENKGAFENRSEVVNKVLLQDITSGNVFTNSHIAKISSDDSSLQEGYRALTLPADSFKGKSDTMTPGSFVDIYSSSNNNTWVLENVKIMSLEADKKSDGTTPVATNIINATAVTFAVSADDISDFILNTSKGNLMLVTRNPNDKKVFKRKSSYPDYSVNSMNSLPNLPSEVPISNFSGLPEPLQPTIQLPSVEVIEANVKTKVTFD